MSTDAEHPTMTYVAAKPPLPETPEQLRARIPGWGADLDPADRPSVPRERFDPGATGAHWELPEAQPETVPRERSIEHARLTPVFGTAQPLHGPSGAIRRYAYGRFSEARAAHWLLLIAADRVDVAQGRVAALRAGRPDHLLAETGVRAEAGAHGPAFRRRPGRTDVRHQVLDPLVVLSPWIAGAGIAVAATRALARRRRG